MSLLTSRSCYRRSDGARETDKSRGEIFQYPAHAQEDVSYVCCQSASICLVYGMYLSFYRMPAVIPIFCRVRSSFFSLGASSLMCKSRENWYIHRYIRIKISRLDKQILGSRKSSYSAILLPSLSNFAHSM
jgi:hypothetical protein